MCNRKIIIYSATLFTAIVFLFIGCSSGNLKIDPKNLPPVIKTYKRFTLSGGVAGMQDTGVYIEYDDLYTIITTGSINFCPRGNCKYKNVRPEHGWPLLARIGEQKDYFNPLPIDNNSSTRESFHAGTLYVGYRAGPVTREGNPRNPEYYQDDTGIFTVEIIVWREHDYIQISKFLEEMTEKDHGNKALAETLAHFNYYTKVVLAEKKATQDVEKTKKELQALREEARTSTDQATDKFNYQQSTLMAAKLAALQATLTDLERMKKELQLARNEALQLVQQPVDKKELSKESLNNTVSEVTSPPILVIASPKNGLKTESKTIRLSGVAEDENGLQEIKIFANHRLIDQMDNRGIQLAQAPHPRRLDFNRRIPLEKGENRISIHMIDTGGLSAKKTLLVHHIERRRNVWAVVIGINDYPRIRKLKYAVNDAKAFYDLLVETTQIPAENVFLMINGQANLQQLRSTLGTRLKNKAGKDDMVIIYFAGHGATERDMMSPDGDGLEKYLLPYDADPNDLYASALPMREIAHIFHRIRSERLIFIADACYSGASGGRTVSITGVRASLSDAFLERIAGGKGKIIITASSANEVSVEKDELRHGVFTYYMVEGLRGRADSDQDGLITVDEAYRYVSDKVTRATGQEQHPVKKGSVEGRLVISVVQ